MEDVVVCLAILEDTMQNMRVRRRFGMITVADESQNVSWTWVSQKDVASRSFRAEVEVLSSSR